MANADRPKGFEPIGPYSLKSHVASEDIKKGEFVKLASDGKVAVAAAGDRLLGLCMSRSKNDGDRVMVVCDPKQRYVGQADEAEIDAQTDVGNLCDILATADSGSPYDASRQEIDSSSIGTGSGGQLRIVDIQRRPDNAYGAQADVIVEINEHQYQASAADFAGV